MPYYRVFFRYVSGKRVIRDSVRLDAKNKEDAKRRTIRGEKPKLIAVDKVKRI